MKDDYLSDKPRLRLEATREALGKRVSEVVILSGLCSDPYYWDWESYDNEIYTVALM
jgi:hypothetical protein